MCRESCQLHSGQLDFRSNDQGATEDTAGGRENFPTPLILARNNEITALYIGRTLVDHIGLATSPNQAERAKENASIHPLFQQSGSGAQNNAPHHEALT